MPKISEERKAERREQILDGARRCFAEYGYEGATVVRLEEATGLSRGAIFNYFPSKEDLFVELAGRDAARMSEIFVERGVEGVVREIVELDPDWLSVYLELFRRLRTDPGFGHKVDERQHAVAVDANRAKIADAQKAGEFRADLEPKEIGSFLSLVLDGLALRRASGEDPPSTDLVLRLIDDAIGGKGRRKRATAKPPSPRTAAP